MVVVILSLLALVLLLGNAYLYLFPGRNDQAYWYNGQSVEQLEGWERSFSSLHEKNHAFERKVVVQEKAVAKKLKSLDTSILNLHSKTEEAMKRIGRLESGTAAKGISGEQLSFAGKMERLEDFRRNATIEIEAIKENMPELKKKKGMKSNPEMGEKIHNLVFHGKTKNG